MNQPSILATFQGGFRKRAIALASTLLITNVVVWLIAIIEFRSHPVLLGTAFLAYSFGLRHAVDADHIAAVDNITRKLMQDGRRPLAIGLVFSLGHSTIVVLLSAVVAATASALRGPGFAQLRAIGGTISTAVSALFLLAIAAANMVVLLATWKSFRALRRGIPPTEGNMDILLSGGGLMARLLRNLFHLIEWNWQIYLLGFLFGLGFDTATEVGLLGISAAGGAQGLSPWALMIFPMLFSAGMALIDTADGLLMIGAYGWAYVKPIRKLYYNLTITALSVLVALLVGSIETLGLLHEKFGFKGRFWSGINAIATHFGVLGYGIIGLFIAGWIFSMIFYRMAGIDDNDLITESTKPESLLD
ncbi:MAG: HoxN/HupN/NixA family nickel/cobalt transporter [Paracoccaceae bacterium]|nr:HoxN/HupN/NixA family nickel/cobalt transporter [Paracoccaceae bacterium]